MSAFGGKADIAIDGHNVANDPERTSLHHAVLPRNHRQCRVLGQLSPKERIATAKFHGGGSGNDCHIRMFDRRGERGFGGLVHISPQPMRQAVATLQTELEAEAYE
jgi:hypothetical protein